jgi:hypothetical protein
MKRMLKEHLPLNILTRFEEILVNKRSEDCCGCLYILRLTTFLFATCDKWEMSPFLLMVIP